MRQPARVRHYTPSGYGGVERFFEKVPIGIRSLFKLLSSG